MKKIFLLILVGSIYQFSFCQEFEFNVNVDGRQARVTNPEVFEKLEETIRDFMNNRSWTDEVYEENEKIKGNMQITITTENGSNYGAEFTIQAIRPVYGSSYETTILNHRDKDFSFYYEQFQPIQYTENAFTDNLSHLLTYYGYLILGLDKDSFSQYGGTPYFEKAQSMLNTIPSEKSSGGWDPGDKKNRNRYWIIENFRSPRMKNFRAGWYDYHINGLDKMEENAAVGRSFVLEGMNKIYESSIEYQNAVMLSIFSNTKLNEIVDIFKVADSKSKQKIKDIMTRIDPANISKYKKELR